MAPLGREVKALDFETPGESALITLGILREKRKALGTRLTT